MKSIAKIVARSKTDSPIEELLYQELINFSLEPKCQYNVGPFFLDLAYPEVKLAIEADGKDYHSSPEQIRRDKYRQEKLEKQGWKFERFRGWFLKRHPKVAAAKIALRYFSEKLTESGKKNALGIIAAYFAIRKDGFTERLLDSALAEKMKLNKNDL